MKNFTKLPKIGDTVLRRKNTEPERWVPTVVNETYLELIKNDEFGDFKPLENKVWNDILREQDAFMTEHRWNSRYTDDV